MQTVHVATKNQHKLAEFARLLAPYEITPIGLAQGVPDSPEQGSSFAANAMEKAAFYSRFCEGWVLADDSGICVDSLGGAPGVHSARYAGPGASEEDLRAHLLQALGNSEARSASMVCVLALWHAQQPVGLVAQGTVAGKIVDAQRGHHGFGYDPLFYLPRYGRTMAELQPEEKDAVSHRGLAVRHLMEAWAATRSAQTFH